MPRESSIQAQIIKYLKEQGAWVFKAHGSPYSRPGVPDLLVCYQGKFLGLEVKVPERVNGVTRAQTYELERIIEAGGLSRVVTNVGDAEAAIQEVLGTRGTKGAKGA